MMSANSKGSWKQSSWFDPRVLNSTCVRTKVTVVKAALGIIVSHGYVPYVKQRGEEIREKKANPAYKARRWIVEVSHSWFNRFRKLLVRFEKYHATHVALLQLAAAIITYRKIISI